MENHHGTQTHGDGYVGGIPQASAVGGCQKRYHADYRSMPKAWLGEYFFREAEMLKQANPKVYSEEYLGLPYKEPKKNVPHGTIRGKKKIAECKNKKIKGKQKHG